MIKIYINDNMDLSEIVDTAEYTSTLNNGASVLKFECAFSQDIKYDMGDTVRLVVDDNVLFFGYLFDSTVSGQKIKFTCYDQLVYLAAKNSFMLKNQPLTQSINDISYLYSDGLRVRLGNIENTELNLKAKNVDDKSGLDVAYELIDENRLANGYWYALYDYNGALNLTDIVNMRLPIAIGDNSLGHDYEYSISIKNDTYNYIKSAKDDKASGTRNIFIAQDSKSIQKWGKLVYYNKINAELNDTQISQQSNMILLLKNRPTQQLRVNSLGDIRVRGGSGVKVEISDININFWAVVTKVVHKFKGNEHTMSLDLDWGGAI